MCKYGLSDLSRKFLWKSASLVYSIETIEILLFTLELEFASLPLLILQQTASQRSKINSWREIVCCLVPPAVKAEGECKSKSIGRIIFYLLRWKPYNSNRVCLEIQLFILHLYRWWVFLSSNIKSFYINSGKINRFL